MHTGWSRAIVDADALGNIIAFRIVRACPMGEKGLA